MMWKIFLLLYLHAHEKFMNIFYYGMQGKNCNVYCLQLCPVSLSLSIPCQPVVVAFYFLFAAQMCRMHSHKYCKRTICFTLHRKTFVLIKIFEKGERAKKRARKAGAYTRCKHTNTHTHIFAKRYKMDYVAFFPSFFSLLLTIYSLKNAYS